MPSQLSTASSILSRGVFDDLSSFEQLEQRVSRLGEENTKVLGDAFEIFVEAFLATQPKFMAEEVWLVGQVPLTVRQEMNLPNDTKGIDGIYRTRTGTLVPYQVKFRSKRAYLTYTEVAPFLGLTERAKDRIIFTNSNEIAVDAKNRDAMRSVRGGDFDELTPDDFKAIECWLKEKPFELPKPQPRDYQTEALDAICGTLETHDRATAVMACGTGKTLLALWVTERLKPKTVLVLVPSLTLLQQTLDEWSRNNSWGTSFSYLCVCSDPSVVQGSGNDSIELHAVDVGFSVDTDPTQVRRFLERDTDHVKVVFCTYQSSDVVINASKGLSSFDVAIFDEAHKTTGPKGGLFSLCLSEENLKVSKRLFLTATPRHYDIRHRDNEGDFKVVSMDDEAVYGPRAYTLTFGAAAKRGIICNYKVVISLVDRQEISQFALDHGITVVDGDLIGAKWVANQIAVERAVQKTSSVRAITFHSRVSSAVAFSSNTPRGVKQFLPDFSTFHVSGSQKSSERKQLIKAFRDAPKAIITNARCLTEGIDIPAVDMVVFIDPRQSRVDIAQATGRAMRKPRGSDKTTGYIIIPLFLDREADQSFEEALESSDFSEISSVLNAMQEQDEDLVQVIRDLKEHKGRGEAFNPSQLFDKIEVIGPALDLFTLRTSIYSVLVENMGVSWDEWYGRLRKFRETEGHCLVNINYVDQGYLLGSWVSVQRKKKDVLLAERYRRLDEIGFVWDPFTELWEEGYRSLLQFKEREGHCRVASRHVEDGQLLGSWVGVQRDQKDRMPADRRRRLDEIGFVWNTRTEAWDEGFYYLAKFKEREGHSLVQQNHVEDGYRLGLWVSNQRGDIDKIPEGRRQRLNEIGFVWNTRADAWEEGFKYLLQFKEREGHCTVQKNHVEDGYRLGLWVSHLRADVDRIPNDSRNRLDEIGFVWDVLASLWEEGFRNLLRFKEREGHCLVNISHVEEGYLLGSWVSVQRKQKARTAADRILRLDDIGFVWAPLTEQWEKGFTLLAVFKEREGHCQVPRIHIEDGFRLANWVKVQRSQKDTMSADRRSRLDQIGFVWDPLTEQWDEGFKYLLQFKEREGHCDVPRIHIEDGYRLGRWVGTQRSQKDELSADRRRRLDGINFVVG